MDKYKFNESHWNYKIWSVSQDVLSPFYIVRAPIRDEALAPSLVAALLAVPAAAEFSARGSMHLRG